MENKVDGYHIEFKNDLYIGLRDPKTIGELLLPEGFGEEDLPEELDWIKVEHPEGHIIYYTKEAYKQQRLQYELYNKEFGRRDFYG